VAAGADRGSVRCAEFTRLTVVALRPPRPAVFTRGTGGAAVSAGSPPVLPRLTVITPLAVRVAALRS
tara:strand:+ start:538 stop:738 length:201 start_codon:yes stop_codon:yes gene_type:complete